MDTIPVSSSLIAGATYDAAAGEISITFKNGQSWKYGDAAQPFTQEDADAFASASSAGKHFLENIRDAFPARRG